MVTYVRLRGEAVEELKRRAKEHGWGMTTEVEVMLLGKRVSPGKGRPRKKPIDAGEEE